MADLYDARSGRKIELPRGRGLAGGGGGPHDPGMEARIARLESDLSDIRTVLGRVEQTLTKIRDDTSEIRGKLSHMPTMLQIGGIMLAINAGIIGVAALLLNLLRG